jgi:hypothetical protein
MTAQPGAAQRAARVASRPPPVSDEANLHGGRGPNRRTAAAAAAPIAPTASANAEPAGATGPSIGSNATAQRVKCSRIRSAIAPNRRSQPRTVAAGTPRRAAIGRCPDPAAFATNASPMSATASRRRARPSSGSSTCVDPQPVQRPRRGRNRRVPARLRSSRSRAQPHRRRLVAHTGHTRRPATKSASTTTGSTPTMSTATPPGTVRKSPLATRSRG